MKVVENYDSLSNEQKDNVDLLVAQVIDGVSKENTIGEVEVNFQELLSVLEKLNAVKKTERANHEAALKEEKARAKEEMEVKAAENAKNIELGTWIEFKTNGLLCILPVVSKNPKSFTVELPIGFYSKNEKRYPKFGSVIKTFASVDEAKAEFEEMSKNEKVAFSDVYVATTKAVKKSA